MGTREASYLFVKFVIFQADTALSVVWINQIFGRNPYSGKLPYGSI